MIRQVVFGILLGIAPAISTQNTEIPLSRLTADATLAITLEPGAAASDDAVWIPNRGAGTVVRVDAKDNRVHPAVAVADACASIVAAFKSVWVPSCRESSLVRVDPADRKVSATAAIGVADPGGRISSGVGSIWVVADKKGIVTRIDPDTNQPVAEIHVAGGASSVLFSGNTLWVTSGTGNRLTRINPHTNEIVEVIEVGREPGPLAAADGALWTLNRADGSITRVDAETNKVVATIAIGDTIANGDIAAGEGSVWISAPKAPLVRIDPRTNKVAQQFAGEPGGAVLVAHGSLWVAVGAQTWRLDPKLVAATRP